MTRPYREGLPLDVLVYTIQVNATAVLGFANAYTDVVEADTSPDERRKLVEVADLLDQALDRFK